MNCQAPLFEKFPASCSRTRKNNRNYHLHKPGGKRGWFSIVREFVPGHGVESLIQSLNLISFAKPMNDSPD